MTTRIGHFVARAWAHQGIRPGVIALSHHMGRWRLDDDRRQPVGERQGRPRAHRRRHLADAATPSTRQPFESDDPDSSRIYWEDPGVHQNLTFPVQPDPWSGMHCWLQQVTVEPAPSPATATATSRSTPRKSREVYQEWLALTRPGPERRGLAPAGVHDAAGQAEAQGVPGADVSDGEPAGCAAAPDGAGAVRAAGRRRGRAAQPVAALGELGLSTRSTAGARSLRSRAVSTDDPAYQRRAASSAVRGGRAVAGTEVEVALVADGRAPAASSATGCAARHRRPGALGSTHHGLRRRPPARAASASRR